MPRPALPPQARTQTELAEKLRMQIHQEIINEHELAEKLRMEIERVLLAGFWFCLDCDTFCEREEGEQGQPPHCHRCKSPRIQWNPPIHQNKKEVA